MSLSACERIQGGAEKQGVRGRATQARRRDGSWLSWLHKDFSLSFVTGLYFLQWEEEEERKVEESGRRKEEDT